MGIAAGASSGFGSSAAGASSVTGAGAASAAGFSRGATGAGSSILGGASSASATLAGTAGSLCLGLKKSPTRADRRRPTLADFDFSSFFSSFSSFYRCFVSAPIKSCPRWNEQTFSSLGASVAGAASAAGASVAAFSLQKVQVNKEISTSV